MRTRFSISLRSLLAGTVAGAALAASQASLADDKAMIDANTQRALTWIRSSGGSSAQLLNKAAGVLVFPDVVKMGFGVGGEFGEGTLVVDGKTEAYYASAGQKFGNLPNAQYKAEVIFFMTEGALQAFRNAQGWKVGENAVVPVLTDTTKSVASIAPSTEHVGLVFSEAGVVPDLGLDGVKVTQIYR
jgi:lipid-binding SYLF domain-containing protein